MAARTLWLRQESNMAAGNGWRNNLLVFPLSLHCFYPGIDVEGDGMRPPFVRLILLIDCSFTVTVQVLH